MDFTRIFKISSNFHFGFDFDFGNLIDLLGIIVNIGIAYYIAKVVQDKQSNKRVLKDYFISEVIEIEKEYKNFYNKFLKGEIQPQRVLEWFKVINIRTETLHEFLKEQYSIDTIEIKNYRSNLLNLNNIFFTKNLILPFSASAWL